jgi:hypothetical protein
LSSEEDHFRGCDFCSVDCENSVRGCSLRVERRSLTSLLPSLTLPRFLAAHSRECEHALVACSHEGCPETLQRREMDSHLSCCPHRLVPCPNACGVTLPSREIASHRATVCRRELVPCPHRQASGVCASTCESQYLREDLSRHQDSPEYLRVEIQHLSQLVHQQQSTINRFEVITGQLQATVTTQVFLGSQFLSLTPASGRLDLKTRIVHRIQGLSATLNRSSPDDREI